MNIKNILIGAYIVLLSFTLLLFVLLKYNEPHFTVNISSLSVLQNTNESYSAELESGGNLFYYTSKIHNGKTNSSLRIIKNKVVIYESNYQLDTTITGYRLLQHKKIVENARSLKFGLGEEDYLVISAQVKIFLEKLFESSGIRKRHVQSIFFHFAIINTRQRAMHENHGIYECVPHPEYLLGKSYFWCQEDFLVKVSLLKDIFKKHPELMDDPKTGKLYTYLKFTAKDYLPYDIIYSFSVTKENYLKSIDHLILRNNPVNPAVKLAVEPAGSSDCLIGGGSERGCCGNYNGCCLLRTIECYIHDSLCSACDPRWFCFSGCLQD